MRLRSGRWVLAVALVGILYFAESFACRYSIRDVAFVELGPPVYRLYCYVRNDTPASSASAAWVSPLARRTDAIREPISARAAPSVMVDVNFITRQI